MRKFLTIFIIAAFVTIPAFAEYTVVLRDGTSYKAKEKWKVVDGQALITLESGTQISLDPRLIDVERTDQANTLGIGDARLINVEKKAPREPTQQRSLGSVTNLRRDSANATPGSKTPSGGQPPIPVGESDISKDTISKFQRAYDNVGLFDAKVGPVAPETLKVSLTANSEDEVFKAISATAFLLSNLDEVAQVQLFMATLTGGSAGKFEMTRDDAKALNGKHINWHSYYVQKVIF